MDIDYITDKDINRQIEEDYKANVLKLKKEIKENGLQKENEEKLLKLVDYIFSISDKYSYVNDDGEYVHSQENPVLRKMKENQENNTKERI